MSPSIAYWAVDQIPKRRTLPKVRMRQLTLEGNVCKFELHGSCAVGMGNAIRRSLMSDVINYAPKEITIRKNTTCQTDEFIAHRIGMIPFRRVSDDIEGAMTVNVVGREAMASDFVGTAYYAPTNIPIIKMIDDQELDLDVVFTKGTGNDHVKFSHVGKVGYKVVTDNHVKVEFEIITDESPLDYLERAIDALSKRLRDTLCVVESGRQ